MTSAAYVTGHPTREQEHVAQAALAIARAELGLPRITIRWFRQAETVEDRMAAALASVARLVDAEADAAKGFVTWEAVNGVAWQEEPDAIWLNVRRTGRDLAHTTFHEARHRWQHQSFGWPKDVDERGMFEHDASRYAETRVPEG